MDSGSEFVVCPKCGTSRPADISQCSICPPQKAPSYLGPRKKLSLTSRIWLALACSLGALAVFSSFGIEEDRTPSLLCLVLASFALVLFVRSKRA